MTTSRIWGRVMSGFAQTVSTFFRRLAIGVVAILSIIAVVIAVRYMSGKALFSRLEAPQQFVVSTYRLGFVLKTSFRGGAFDRYTFSRDGTLSYQITLAPDSLGATIDPEAFQAATVNIRFLDADGFSVIDERSIPISSLTTHRGDKNEIGSYSGRGEWNYISANDYEKVALVNAAVSGLSQGDD